MKIIVTKEFANFIKTNKMIINSFLFASLVITSLTIGFVPQIPLWVLLITMPTCLISMIVFYIKSYSYIHENWIYCKNHESDLNFSNKKYLKYIFLSVFMLIPGFNWIPIIAIIKYEKKKIELKSITCKKDHLKIRSGVVKTRTEEHSKNRVEEFDQEF